MVRVLESLRDQRALLTQEIESEEKQKLQLQKQLDALNFKVPFSLIYFHKPV